MAKYNNPIASQLYQMSDLMKEKNYEEVIKKIVKIRLCITARNLTAEAEKILTLKKSL